MEDFSNALDRWQIDRKDAYAALRALEQKNYLLTITCGEHDELQMSSSRRIASGATLVAWSLAADSIGRTICPTAGASGRS
jgi:hypothetical protein